MEKQAARYASQPTINIQPSVPFQGMARSSALFPFTQGTDLFKAQQQGRNNPNPVASPKTPLPVLANTQGIQQALQKQGEEFTWLLNAIRDAFIFSKRAELIGSSPSSNKPQSNKTISPSFSNNFTNTNKNQSNFSVLSNNTQPGMPGGNTNNPLGGFGMVGSMMGGMNRNNQIKPSINLGIHTSSPTPMKTAAMGMGMGNAPIPGPASMPPAMGGGTMPPGGAPPMPPPGMPPQGAGGAMPPPMPPGGAPPPGAQGQPPMPGQPPGMQPPMAPMTQPPPMPLPSNPVPPQSKPKTSQQAQEEANMLGLLESKQAPDTVNQDMKSNLMASDVKMGVWKYAESLAIPDFKPLEDFRQNKVTQHDTSENRFGNVGTGLGAIGGLELGRRTAHPGKIYFKNNKMLTAAGILSQLAHMGLMSYGGALGGNWLGKKIVGSLPEHYQNPVSAQSAPIFKADMSKQASHDPRMQGWHWKALQKEENSNKDNWLPRMITSDKTPLSEMLASPGKSGILGGLLGGGAGALGGHNINSLINTGNEDWKNSLIGGGVGALLGGFGGFSHRVKQNDKVSDALRRLPAGATLDDMKGLDKTKSGFDKYAGLGQLMRPVGSFISRMGSNLMHSRVGNQAGQTALGAGFGALTGGSIGGEVGNNMGTWGGAMAGAALGNPYLRNQAMRRLGPGTTREAINPMMGAGSGAAYGNLIDQGAQFFGHNTGGSGAQLGGMAGMALGNMTGGVSNKVLNLANRWAMPATAAGAAGAVYNHYKPGFDKYADPMTPLQRYQASQARLAQRTLQAQQALKDQEVHNAGVRGTQVPGQQEGWGSSGSGGVRAIPGGRATVTSQGGGYTPQPQVQVSGWQGERPQPQVQVSGYPEENRPQPQVQVSGYPEENRPAPQPGYRRWVPPQERNGQEAGGGGELPQSVPPQAPPVTLPGTNKPGVYGLGQAKSGKPGFSTGYKLRDFPSGTSAAGQAKSGFDKYGAQARDKYHSPQRSATGESKGLSFNHKSDDYAQGQEAWAATSKYFKGGIKKIKEPNPFIGDHIGKEASLLELTDTPFVRGFLSHCRLLGLSNNFIKQAVTKLEKDYPEGAVELKAALQKRAFSKAYTFQFEKQAGLPELASGLWKGIATHAWPAVKPIAKQVLPSLGGGVAGSFAGEQMGLPGTMPIGNSGFGFNPYGFAAGAVAFNPALKSRAMFNDTGRIAQRGIQHGIIGADAGAATDIGLGMMGLDTSKYLPGGLASWGGYGGLASGVAGGLGARGYARGTPNMLHTGDINVPHPSVWAKNISRTAPVIDKPWLTGFNKLEGGAAKHMTNFAAGAFEPIQKALTYPARKIWSTRPGGSPTNFFGNLGNPNNSMSRWAGRAFGGTALGIGAAVGANNLIKGYGKNLAQESAHEMYPEFAQRTMNDTAGFLDQYMQSRGMLNQQGQFSPLGNIGQHVSNFSDNILQSLNMNPHNMSPMQKMMVLGGGAAGLGGAMTGHQMLAGGGGLTALMGALPQFMNRGYNQGGHQDRNEWEYQQRLAQQRGQNGREF